MTGAGPRSTDADAALRAAAGRPMVAEPALERAAIRDAHAGIPRVFCDSPQYVHEVLSAEAGRPVIVKVETVNPIGAFKGRGTWTGLRALLERGAVGEGRPVVGPPRPGISARASRTRHVLTACRRSSTRTGRRTP